MTFLIPKKIYYNTKDPLRGFKIKYIIKKYKGGARYCCVWMSRQAVYKPFFDLGLDLEIDILWDQTEWREYV